MHVHHIDTETVGSARKIGADRLFGDVITHQQQLAGGAFHPIENSAI